MVPALLSVGLACWSVRAGAARADARRGAAVGLLGAVALLHPSGSANPPLIASLIVAAIVPVVISAMRRTHHTARRRVLLTLGAAAMVSALSLVALVIAGLSARAPARSGVDRARSALDATRAGNLEAATTRFADSQTAFADAHSTVSAPWLEPALFIPVLGANLQAIRTGISAGADLAGAAHDAAAAAPYDQIHLDAGRIDLAAIDALAAPVSALQHTVDQVGSSLAAIDDTWLFAPVRTRVQDLATQVDDASPQVATAALAVDQLPDLFGQNGTRTYLVVFTSEAESRFLGGFAGSFGILTAQNGAVHFDGSGGSGSLDAKLGPDVPYVATAAFKERYARFRMQEFAQNWTAAPDLPSDAAVMEQLYAHATGVHVDGVLTIDPAGIAALLRITGPIKVDGVQTLNAGNVVEYLLHGQYVQFGLDPTQRRDLLAEIAKKAFDELLRTPSTTYKDLSRAFGPAVEQGHLMVTVFEPRSEELLDQIDVTGRFDPHPGDLLFSLRNADSLANKIDWFLHRSTTYDATIDPRTGIVDAEVTMVLANDAPSTGLPPYIIGTGELAPRGESGNLLSIYSSLSVVGATVDDQPVMFQSEREFDVNVLTRGVSIPSKGSRTVRLHLRGTVALREGSFTISLPHQPVVNDDPISITIRSTDPRSVPAAISGFDGATLSAAPGALTVSGPAVHTELLTVRFAPS